MPTDQKPLFSSTVFCPASPSVSVDELKSTLRDLAPQVKLGGWHSDKASETPQADAKLVSVDDIRLAILAVDAPASKDALDTGRRPNLLMPDAYRALEACASHIVIVPTVAPDNRRQALKVARSVTLLTWAVAVSTEAAAFRWADANQIVPTSSVANCSRLLSEPGEAAVPIWVRVLVGQGPANSAGHDTLKVGTLGLWAFDAAEIEFQESQMPLSYYVPRLYAACDYILRLPGSLKSGDTIDLGGATVRVEEQYSHNTGRTFQKLLWR